LAVAGLIREHRRYVRGPFFDVVEKDTLLQPLERRVLTYTPDNPPTWQVVMNHAGQQYLRWRHGR
jgi:hypothetical protein